METHLHFDCFSGLAGDMFLGACLDLGMPLALLEDVVERLGLENVGCEQRRSRRGGISGVRFRVLLDGASVEGPDPEEEATPGRHHRHDPDAAPPRARSLASIRRQVEKSALGPVVKERTIELFARLGEAEARVHDVAIEEVHFHELGAIDALLDLAGAATAWEHFAPSRATCGPVNVGGGIVETAHGHLPVPAPATARLLEGVPIYGDGGAGELLTPTGAVLLAELIDEFADLPRLTPTGVGYGLGKKETPGRPNAFRLLRGVCERTSAGGVVQVACTVDDVSPEGLGYLMERLLERAALDVFFAPVQMKKNRPGVDIRVLCRAADVETVAGIVLSETGALGCRYHPVGRFEAERSLRTVHCAYGEVRIKEGRFAGRSLGPAPEYEDCRRLALERNVPWREVYRAALAAARGETDGS